MPPVSPEPSTEAADDHPIVRSGTMPDAGSAAGLQWLCPGLPQADLEAVYDALAEAIDRAGPPRSERLLAKLALLAAQALGDRARFEALLRMAEADD